MKISKEEFCRVNNWDYFVRFACPINGDDMADVWASAEDHYRSELLAYMASRYYGYNQAQTVAMMHGVLNNNPYGLLTSFGNVYGISYDVRDVVPGLFATWRRPEPPPIDHCEITMYQTSGALMALEEFCSSDLSMAATAAALQANLILLAEWQFGSDALQNFIRIAKEAMKLKFQKSENVNFNIDRFIARCFCVIGNPFKED